MADAGPPDPGNRGKEKPQPKPFSSEDVPEEIRGLDVTSLEGKELEDFFEKTLHKQLEQQAERRKQEEEKLADKVQESNVVQSELQRRRMDIDTTMKKLADREQRLKSKMQQYQSAKKTVESEEARQAQDRLRELERKEMEINRREAALSDRETGLASQVAELEARRQSMAQEQSQLENRMKDVEGRFSKGEITAKERDRQLKQANDQLETLRSELTQRQRKLDEQESVLQKELDEARAIKARESEGERKMREEKDQLEARLKDMIKIRDDAAKRERSFLEVEQELQGEIGQLMEQRKALSAHEEVLAEDKERLEAEIKQIRESSTQMREAEEDARKKLTALETSLRTAVEEVGTLKVKLNEETRLREGQEKEAEARRQELERYEKKLHEEITLRQRAERSFEEARRGLHDAEEELKKDATLRADLEKQLVQDEGRMAELEAALEGARGESLKLTKRLQAEDKELEVLKKNLDDQKKRREISEGKVKELEEATQTLEREMEASTLKRGVLEEQLGHQTKEIEKISAQLVKDRETLRAQESLTRRTQAALEEARGHVDREVGARQKVEHEARRLEDSVRQMKAVSEQGLAAREATESSRAEKEAQLTKALDHLREEEQRRQGAQLKVQEQMEELRHVKDALETAERSRERGQEQVDKLEREITKLHGQLSQASTAGGSDKVVSEEVKRLAADLERARVDVIEAQKEARLKEQAVAQAQQAADKEKHARNELELKLRFVMEEMDDVRRQAGRAEVDAKAARDATKDLPSAGTLAALAAAAPPAMKLPASYGPGAAPSPPPSAAAPAAPPGRELQERMHVLGSAGTDIAPLRKLDESLATPPAPRRAIPKGRLSLPGELLNYLAKPNGRSIILGGKRRTGKSNLALELAEALANFDDEVLLLQTQDVDPKLLEAYPWVAEKRIEDFLTFQRFNTPESITQPPAADQKAARQKLLEAVRAVRKDMTVAGLPPVLDRPKAYRINTERIMRLLSLNPGMVEIINLYDAVERLLPNKVVIVIDRADALARKYGIEYKSLIDTLHRDLVRGANCDLIIVQERDDQHSADKTADGVLVMRDISRTEEFLGELAITNLTDVVLKRPRALYRFEEGRIRMIESADVGSGMEG